MPFLLPGVFKAYWAILKFLANNLDLLKICRNPKQDFDELLIEKNRYGAIWLHFVVRPKDNRRKILFINA